IFFLLTLSLRERVKRKKKKVNHKAFERKSYFLPLRRRNYLMETLFGVSMDTIMAVVLSLSIVVLLVGSFLAWRNPIILRIALRNIPRRRAQTVLIVFGLMLATLLVTAAFGTGDTMTYS